MAIKLHLQKEALPILRQMADEAGLTLHDMAEIAVYNLIAVYTASKGTEVAPGVLAPLANPALEFTNPTE